MTCEADCGNQKVEPGSPSGAGPTCGESQHVSTSLACVPWGDVEGVLSKMNEKRCVFVAAPRLV